MTGWVALLLVGLIVGVLALIACIVGERTDREFREHLREGLSDEELAEIDRKVAAQTILLQSLKSGSR